jgi:nucleotide-binding universal stress UspA family protein
MDRIIVGVDGSAASLGALQWALAFGNPTETEVIAMNVYRPSHSELKPATHERLEQRQRNAMERWCADVAGDLTCRVDVVEGDPREQLPAAVERLGADLLVLAPSGATGQVPGFLHLGSVVEYLVHHCDVPLAVVPTGFTSQPRVATLAVDGSEHGFAAAQFLARLTAADTAVVVLTVEPGEPSANDAGTGPGALSAAQRLVETTAEAFSGEHRPCTTVVHTGVPVVEGILETAAQHDSDLLVLGMRGTGGFTSLRLGGVALAVCHRATVPLVLVPLPQPAG